MLLTNEFEVNVNLTFRENHTPYKVEDSLRKALLFDWTRPPSRPPMSDNTLSV